MPDALPATHAPGFHAPREVRIATGLQWDWVGIVERALSFIAGALVGVLWTLFLVMGWS